MVDLLTCPCVLAVKQKEAAALLRGLEVLQVLKQRLSVSRSPVWLSHPLLGVGRAKGSASAVA